MSTQLAHVPLVLVQDLPKRDVAAEVFTALRDRIIAAKRAVGISPATGPRKLSSAQRREITARIREHGDDDEGLAACLRVIDVDERECVAQGPKGASWAWWDATTPWRAANFERRLNRWRTDGGHASHGGSPSSSGPQPALDGAIAPGRARKAAAFTFGK